MSGKKRWDVYIWPTWLAGLLAGDQSCEWQAWFKAHFQYDKRPDVRTNQLAQWAAEHADMVRQRAEQLRADGWAVTVEDQNKFNLRGQVATVGGKPDIVAVRAGEVRIEDCKTGKPRERDYWQVVLYVLLAPKALALPEGARLEGAVVYRTWERLVPAEDAERGRALVLQRIHAAAGPEPRRTPSAKDCDYCDIATCPDRVTEHVGSTETREF